MTWRDTSPVPRAICFPLPHDCPRGGVVPVWLPKVALNDVKSRPVPLTGRPSLPGTARAAQDRGSAKSGLGRRVGAPSTLRSYSPSTSLPLAVLLFFLSTPGVFHRHLFSGHLPSDKLPGVLCVIESVVGRPRYLSSSISPVLGAHWAPGPNAQRRHPPKSLRLLNNTRHPGRFLHSLPSVLRCDPISPPGHSFRPS
jgi:hypothetical protein